MESDGIATQGEQSPHLERVPDRTIHRTEAGRFSLPLRMSDSAGTVLQQLPLVLTANQLQGLAQEIADLLPAGTTAEEAEPTSTVAPADASRTRRSELMDSLVLDQPN